MEGRPLAQCRALGWSQQPGRRCWIECQAASVSWGQLTEPAAGSTPACRALEWNQLLARRCWI
eukprot:3650517-Lingulodinium_polyedra.AAC.1